MPQTDYSTLPNRAFPGLPYDGRPNDRVSATNEESTALLFGTMVADGANENGCKAPDAEDNVFLGVLEHFHKEPTDTGLEADEVGSVIKKGAVWVRCEKAITKSDSVFVRFSAPGGETVGEFTDRGDEVAESQSFTCTPVAVNDEVYELLITHTEKALGKQSTETFYFKVTADASATATEICDAFRTAMAADAEFTARVAVSGSATLILNPSNQLFGNEMKVLDTGNGDMGVVETAGSRETVLLPDSQARWIGDSIQIGSDYFAPLELNLP